jgi:hypothetical protein
MNGSLDSLETRLRAIAQSMPYPPTPDIAGMVRQRLSRVSIRRPTLERKARRWKTALAGVAIILVLLTGLLAVPSVRAAVLEFLQVGVIRIFLPETTATPTVNPSVTIQPTSTLQATPMPIDLVSLGQISGETTLEVAIEKAGFTLSLPTYPTDLGKPDRVFVQDADGAMIILAWTAPDHPDQADLVLFEIAPGSWAGEKGAPALIEHTSVNDHEAVWAEGPYPLFLTDGNVDFRRLISGHVLLWVENGITYRLENTLTLPQAVQIAESLSPIR